MARYKYLGISFHRKSQNVDKMLEDRVTAGQKMIGTISPFLRSPNISVLRNVVVSRLWDEEGDYSADACHPEPDDKSNISSVVRGRSPSCLKRLLNYRRRSAF